jgi:hypothetical protein
MTKYWVSMTDKFMSGWGRAEGRTNKLVIECDSYEEAEIVAQNARNRSEMKFVNICASKPRYSKTQVTYILHDKSDYSAWFIAGRFKPEDR